MSYTLDTLRKSEEERHKSNTKAAGSGFTFVRDTTPPKRKFAFGLILTSFMLLVAIILGGGWWWSQVDQVESTLTTNEEQPALITDNAVVRQDIKVASAPSKQEVAEPPAKISPSLKLSSQPVDEIPYLSEMSADFQAKMPDLTFSGHVYSPEPSLRMIMINDAVVREGDPVGTELSLDEITKNGVVIRHDETRFRIKLL
ncbi:MAG: general secretion pathway protein GspB [Desulfofustis sp.]|nr:general secretion pathway protein GspB [Desulfofustis sp.]MBT8353612.1 general secretion pathway protein GspB [Desulfofustis sp.]NNF46572.1 GspB domain-containing protein [Desulfofustis sp.]